MVRVNIIIVRVLKNCWIGEIGICCDLEYNKEIGRMIEFVFIEEVYEEDF